MMASSALWKGKGREDIQEVDDLNPTITYRHLLSSGLGVRNPLRAIGLCDMDAFYAACEQVRLGIDPSIPLVVRQWDALIAVNYPARSYGISRMDKVASALQRCPHLRVVHVATYDPSTPDAKPSYIDNPNGQTHKVSLDHYRRESKKILQVFKEVLPGAEVEKASIDEAFIDFTEPIRQHILAHFPHFSTPPLEGLDSPLPPPPCEGVPLPHPQSRTITGQQNGNIWTDLGTLIPVSSISADPPVSKDTNRPSGPDSLTSTVSQIVPEIIDGVVSGEGLGSHLAFNEHSWSAELEVTELDDDEDMRSLSDRENRGSSVSPEFQKIDTPSNDDHPPTWHDLALSIAASLMLMMRNEVKTRLGYTTSAGIARNKFLAKTILRNAAIPSYLGPLPFQKIRFLGGKLGTAIAATYEAQTVSDLLSISIEEMQRKFGENSIWIWEILRGIDRSEVKEKSPVTKSMGASKNLQRPIKHPSEGAHWLRILAGELGFRLLEAREDNPGLWPKTLVLHVRQSYDISRSKQAPFPFTRNVTTGFICKAAEKLWAELVGTSAEYDKNLAKGKAATMKITNVFLGFTGVEAIAAGQQSIEGFFPGSEAEGKRKANVGESARDGEVKKRKRNGRGQNENADQTSDLEAASRSTHSFRCPRCGKQVRRDADTTSDHEEILRSLRMEHEDFHFAQDLARDGNGNDTGAGGATSGSHSSAGTQKKKKKVKPLSIAEFFSPVNSKK